MKISLKEKLKTNKGITLIALVITIIVLLILAGVTIATLTGDNGILSKAQNAKTQNDKASEKEQIELAVLASKINTDASIDKKILKEELERISGVIESGVPTSVDYTIPLTVTGKTGTPYIIDEDGARINHSEIIVSAIAKTGVFANNSNIEEVREGDIPIPKGYKYIKGDKIGGAVITDAASGLEGVGSEFVWIPVSEINDMAQCDQADGTGSTCDIKTDENDGHLYCSTHSNNTNIVGKLYATSIGNNFGTVNASYNANSGLREPANLGSSYDSTSTNSQWTPTLYQEEYNKMVKQVDKYKGFYVGRYETSLNNATATDTGDSDSTSVQSKLGVKSANAILNKTNMWYGLYNMSKTYAPESNTTKSVVSSMIWGSQYDAMMNWMKDNSITVTSSTPSDLSIGTTSKNTTRVTGGVNRGQSVSKDKLNNIYDLLGNSFEWTLEAIYTVNRVVRGGYCNYSYSPSNRFGEYPGNFDLVYYGSRLTLYIK